MKKFSEREGRTICKNVERADSFDRREIQGTMTAIVNGSKTDFVQIARGGVSREERGECLADHRNQVCQKGAPTSRRDGS